MRTVLDFVIDDHIGRGSDSLVYRARRLPGGEAVALKCPTADSDPARARLLREAALLERVRHPNLVTLVEVVRMSDTDPPLALALGLVDGGTLAQHLDGEPLDHGRAARLGLDVCGALEAIHRVGIIHADVKPANILLTSEGSAILSDLDAAYLLEEADEPRVRRLTQRYAAPEVIAGAAPTSASDVWSLAAVLFEAVSPPSGPPTPGPLLDTLRRGQDPDPSQRPTVRELSDELAQVPVTGPAPALLPDPPIPVGEPAAVDPHPTMAWGPRPSDPVDLLLRHGNQIRSSGTPSSRSRPAPGRTGVWPAIAGLTLGFVGIIALLGWVSDAFSGPRPSLATAAPAPIEAGEATEAGETPPDPAPCAGSTPDATGEAVAGGSTTAGRATQWADVDGIGCTRAVTWDGAATEVAVAWSGGVRRYRLGQAGDQLVLGDWDGDGTSTPGLYRPSTGESFLFTGWAEADTPLPSTSVVDTGITGGTAVARTAIEGTADHLVVNPTPP